MKVKVKRSGIIFIGVTIFLGVAAANTGNNLLYIVVSSMLSLMLISGISSVFNIKGVEVRLIPPPEVYAGRRTTFRLFVRKRGTFPSFLLRVSSPTDSLLIPLVDGNGTEERIDLIFHRRGRIDGVTLEISSDFPLGMFTRSTEVVVPLGLTVFPTPIPARPGFLSAQGSREGSSPERSVVKGYEELRDIKEYSGEPMKLIHWKLSAKFGTLMVREMVSEDREPVILSLELVSGDLETRLSKLAYLTVELLKLGYPVGLRLKEREIPPRRGELQKLAILSELALY